MMALFYPAHSLCFSNRNVNRKEKGTRGGTQPCSSVTETGPRVVLPPRKNMEYEWYIILSLSKEAQTGSFPGHLPSVN